MVTVLEMSRIIIILFSFTFGADFYHRPPDRLEHLRFIHNNAMNIKHTETFTLSPDRVTDGKNQLTYSSFIIYWRLSNKDINNEMLFYAIPFIKLFSFPYTINYHRISLPHKLFLTLIFCYRLVANIKCNFYQLYFPVLFS